MGTEQVVPVAGMRIVVGAGVAGLACAAALGDVTVVERRPYVGGRAYSYPHPAVGEVIDSQHVLLGCCTNLVDLCGQAGLADAIRWYDAIPFLEPGGHMSRLAGGSAMSFLLAPMLDAADKAGIVRGMMRFVRGIPEDDAEAFDAWLRRTGQTERAVKHFWEPIVVATLNDTLERCAAKYAVMVFREILLRSAAGGRQGIPMRPMSEFYGGVARLAESRGAEIRLKCGVTALRQNGDGWVVETSEGPIAAETVILAVPFEQVGTLLPEDERKGRLMASVEQFVHAPMTTIHLWYDREVTDVDQAALLDTRIQWVFNKSRIRKQAGCYLELVIGASHAEIAMGREEILTSALKELEVFFPAVREAKLLKSAVLKEARATFSVLPGMDQYRPAVETEWPGLFLAGDWTRTGWPSTMESGVRSGRLAAEAVTGKKFLAPDLPASGLMKLFEKR